MIKKHILKDMLKGHLIVYFMNAAERNLATHSGNPTVQFYPFHWKYIGRKLLCLMEKR